MNIKEYIKTHSWVLNLCAWCYRFIGNNKMNIKGKDNSFNINVSGLFLSHSRFFVRGNHNSLLFLPNKNGEVTHFKNLNISVFGNNNTIVIGPHSSGEGFSIYVEDDNNQVVLGEHFTVGNNCDFSVLEGTKIEVGEDCQLSANIKLRTGDSHSITNLQGVRTNPSISIKIGNHVWIGNTVLIFKGANIADNSIIAGGSVVSGKTFPPHSIIGGNPAKVIKDNVNWDRRRLPID